MGWIARNFALTLLLLLLGKILFVMVVMSSRDNEAVDLIIHLDPVSPLEVYSL